MLYHFLYPLHAIFSPLNVFQYITLRTAGAILTSLIISFVAGPFIIGRLRALKIGQAVRSDGPQSHLSKAGTPTMGGLLILFSMVGSIVLWARLDNRFVLMALGGIVYLGLVGFWDDYLKLIRRDPRGLSSRMKFAFQCLLAAVIAACVWYFPQNADFATRVSIPYLKATFIELAAWYSVLVMLVIVGSSNAVNLTDGLDGLAIGNLLIAAVTLGIFSYLAGHARIAQYLRIIPVPGAGELAVVLGALVGAGLGFLWFNAFPAQVFMGDTGSLFLGGTLGLVAVFIKQELILAVVGGVFVAEALSVMIQVVVFRRTGRRVFRMAPLHHHFELAGWPEPTVTVRFWIIGIILALVAIASLKLR